MNNPSKITIPVNHNGAIIFETVQTPVMKIQPDLIVKCVVKSLD
jgi:hypothetical protein